MVDKYLIDTSIWIDLYEDRIGFNGEPLGEYAWKLFFLIISHKNVIICTDLLLRELANKYSLSQINGMLKPFENITEKIFVTKEESDEAKLIALKRYLPQGDVLHSILARNNNLLLITRDKHFKELEDISKHYMPEHII